MAVSEREQLTDEELIAQITYVVPSFATLV